MGLRQLFNEISLLNLVLNSELIALYTDFRQLMIMWLSETAKFDVFGLMQ